MAQILIDAGANVNAKSDYDNTPLHWAVECKSGMKERELFFNGMRFTHGP